MKILVATDDKKGLDDKVSAVFARAGGFAVVYADSNGIREDLTEVYENKFKNEPSNAGKKAADFAVSLGVDLVIAGSIKGNAASVLRENKIEIKTGYSGIKVKNAVEGCLGIKKRQSKPEPKKRMPNELSTSVPERNSNSKWIAIAVLLAIIVGFILYIFS